MTILSAIVACIGKLERRRLYRRTESMIGALPVEIRKDIGWPGSARGLDEADAEAPRRVADAA